MVWCPCRRPYDVEILQPGVEKCCDRIDVSNRGDPADGKPCLRSDQRGIGLAKCLACAVRRFGRIHLIAACGDEKNRCATGLPAKDDGFCDLVDVASDGCGRICGSGVSTICVSIPVLSKVARTRFRLLLMRRIVPCVPERCKGH